jgi:hypothetical protein
VAPKNQQIARHIAHGPYATTLASSDIPAQHPSPYAASGFFGVSFLFHVAVIV